MTTKDKQVIEYWNIKERLNSIDSWQSGCCIRMTCADEDEISQVVDRYGIPRWFFEDIYDTDERARYDADEGWSLIIMRVPFAMPKQSRTPFITVPLGIIFKDGVLLTVCSRRAEMLDQFIDYNIKRGLGFIDHVDLIFKLLLFSAGMYLKYLKQINAIMDQAKKQMGDSIDNESLIALSKLQDSLTYFVTSIRGSESLIDKLKLKLPIDELDADLIDDIRIEMSQAGETSQIYTAILDSTMETCSSIINNNMNTVMRTLTSVSIILMVPTLITSFLGMNLVNGMEQKWWGCIAVLILSAIITAVCWLVFKHKKLI